ncbi:unnamed protein product [Gadus morhua 'NCC']
MGDEAVALGPGAPIGFQLAAVTRLRWEQHKSSPRRRLALLQPVNRDPCTACRTALVGPPPGHVLPLTSSPAGAGGGAKSQTGGWGV